MKGMPDFPLKVATLTYPTLRRFAFFYNGGLGRRESGEFPE